MTSTTKLLDALPLRALFDVLTDGILVTDARGYRTYANGALNDLVGGDARAPIGSAEPPEFLPAGLHDRYRSHLAALSNGGLDHLLSLEWEIEGASGEMIPVAVRLLPVANGSGSPAAFWHFVDVRDTSDSEVRRLRQVERALSRIATELAGVSIGVSPSSTPPAGVDLSPLSAREREVLDLLLDGHRVATIGDRLCVSAHTVRNHLKSMFRKLDVHSQAELIGLIRGGGPGSR